MVEYWSEQATRASWLGLQELRRDFEFTVIGGWAVYLWTKAMKSKDIDIVITFESLEKMRRKFALEKNDALRKYQVKFPEFDLDVYVPYYSKLKLHPEEMLSKYSRRTEGFEVATPESLLVLKQGAELDRRNSTKGRKDAIDILLLCMKSGIDWVEYRKILDGHKLDALMKELVRVVESFPEEDLRYLGASHQEFAKWRKETIRQLKG